MTKTVILVTQMGDKRVSRETGLINFFSCITNPRAIIVILKMKRLVVVTTAPLSPLLNLMSIRSGISYSLWMIMLTLQLLNTPP